MMRSIGATGKRASHARAENCSLVTVAYEMGREKREKKSRRSFWAQLGASARRCSVIPGPDIHSRRARQLAGDSPGSCGLPDGRGPTAEICMERPCTPRMNLVDIERQMRSHGPESRKSDRSSAGPGGGPQAPVIASAAGLFPESRRRDDHRK